MGKVYATDTILRGGETPILAGEEVPESYVDLDGRERDTNFDRLEELGVVTEKKAEAEAAASAGTDAEIQALRDRVTALEAELAEAEAKAEANTGGANDEDGDGNVDNLSELNKPDLEKLAADRNLDVKGTGSNGNVTVEDLRKALSDDSK